MCPYSLLGSGTCCHAWLPFLWNVHARILCKAWRWNETLNMEFWAPVELLWSLFYCCFECRFHFCGTGNDELDRETLRLRDGLLSFWYQLMNKRHLFISAIVSQNASYTHPILFLALRSWLVVLSHVWIAIDQPKMAGAAIPCAKMSSPMPLSRHTTHPRGHITHPRYVLKFMVGSRNVVEVFVFGSYRVAQHPCSSLIDDNHAS